MSLNIYYKKKKAKRGECVEDKSDDSRAHRKREALAAARTHIAEEVLRWGA